MKYYKSMCLLCLALSDLVASKHVSNDFLETQTDMNQELSFRMKTEIRIDSSLDMYTRVIQDLADAVTESQAGD